MLGAVLLLWCCAISARLAWMQIVRYGFYEKQASRQQQRTVEIAPKRGMIYDRAGHELAMTVQVDSGFAIPREIPDLPTTLSLISQVTREDVNALLARCKPDSTFCWVARKTDAESRERIEAMRLKGIYFQKESKRFYPKPELAAQVLGYVGMDDEGLSGIERQFNDELRGGPGLLSVQLDARRRGFNRVEKPPDPGANLVLTIDEKIQYIAERELQTAMDETKAISGTVVVENPRTGEILALANRPTFNPNLTREIRPELLKNHAVSDVYEPGSTFKLVTISAALEEKLTRPDEVFDCQMGSIVVNGMRIHDHKAYGLLSVSDIIANSSDVGAIKVALRLGNDRFYKYIHGFGFGQLTGVELPGETRGLAKPAERWSKVSIGAISMGQEIGISALQLAAMVSTFANDGTWVAPRILAGATEPQSGPQTVVFHPADQRRVVSPLTAAQMKQMMQGVVLHGTARKAILEGYSSAGKTGTAQKVDPATRAYSKTKYVASFAGFAPVNNPAVTVAIILDSAAGLHQGGQIAAPVFQRVTQQVLEYMHVPHDVELPANRQMLLAARKAKDTEFDEAPPEHPGAPLEMADAAASDLPAGGAAKPVPPQAGNASLVTASLRETRVSPPASYPTPPATQTPPPATSGSVVLDVEQGGAEAPSLIGKSVRAAIEAAQDAGFDIEVQGNGLARDQWPAPGTRVAAGSRIVVRFSR